MKYTDLEGFSAVAREHATNPRNYGPLSKSDGHSRISGPGGNNIEFWLTARKDKVDQVSFIADGCGSLRACGSMATVLAAGKRIADAAALQQQDILHALSGRSAEFEHNALLAANALKTTGLPQQDILLALNGISAEFEHSALLATNALKAACEDCLKCQAAASKGSCAEPAMDDRYKKENT
jgi:NifU-like protein involved in Fe-S cluster formation